MDNKDELLRFVIRHTTCLYETKVLLCHPRINKKTFLTYVIQKLFKLEYRRLRWEFICSAASNFVTSN